VRIKESVETVQQLPMRKCNKVCEIPRCIGVVGRSVGGKGNTKRGARNKTTYVWHSPTRNTLGVQRLFNQKKGGQNEKRKKERITRKNPKTFPRLKDRG